MMEEWRPVVGYEDYYEVSDRGNVRSKDRVVAQRNGTQKRIKGRLMTKSKGNGKGYYQSVMVSKDGMPKRKLVHRLVAEAFIPNPCGLPEVNHVDEDKTNNAASNLEWCDRRYNNTFGTIRERMKRTQGIPVVQFDHGVPIAWFCSQGEASRATGASQSGISACLRGICAQSGGFAWKTAR